jgi:hypothetical protein
MSEQDLAQLYVQTEAPLKLDDLLQGREGGQAAQIAVHDSIAHQTPDLALISLSLCGLIIVRDFPNALKENGLGPILRELIVAGEDNLATVGRLWLDSICHGIKPHPKSDRVTIESIPDRLRILTSIFFELRDTLEDGGPEEMRDAMRSLYYQAESHADLADRFVERLTAAAKKRAARAAPARAIPDQIPLPFELSRPQMGAEIVSFSLFHKPRVLH